MAEITKNFYFRTKSDGLTIQIEDASDADVVEVVRCKDCKHFEQGKLYIIQGFPVYGNNVCNAWGDGCATNENGWCYLGERRKDVNDV